MVVAVLCCILLLPLPFPPLLPRPGLARVGRPRGQHRASLARPSPPAAHKNLPGVPLFQRLALAQWRAMRAPLARAPSNGAVGPRAGANRGPGAVTPPRIRVRPLQSPGGIDNAADDVARRFATQPWHYM